MLTAFQGQIQGNSIVLDDLRQFNGRTVTIIVNEPIKDEHREESRQEKKEKVRSNRKEKMLAVIKSDMLVIPTEINADTYVKELRKNDRV